MTGQENRRGIDTRPGHQNPEAEPLVWNFSGAI